MNDKLIGIYYTNPLYKRSNGEDTPLSQPDPYMIFADGKYYVYATNTKGVIAYESDNFADWKYAGVIYSEIGKKEYWAPSVIKIKDEYFMYYSAMPSDSDDVHTQEIRVAVAKNPLGPYEFRAKLLEPFSIDPHVVQTPDGGLYMFYCQNDYDAPHRAGTYIVLDKMIDPFTLEGKPVPVILPTLDEEIYEKDRFKKGQHWHTVEGAFYFEENGIHYLMYSGSAYTKESYFIGYCTATGKTDDLRKLQFKKQPADNIYAPVLKKNSFIEGTGHNSVIKINDSYYVIYHGRDIGDLQKYSQDSRTFRADKLIINGLSLTTAATNTPQKISD